MPRRRSPAQTTNFPLWPVRPVGVVWLVMCFLRILSSRVCYSLWRLSSINLRMVVVVVECVGVVADLGMVLKEVVEEAVEVVFLS